MKRIEKFDLLDPNIETASESPVSLTADIPQGKNFIIVWREKSADLLWFSDQKQLILISFFFGGKIQNKQIIFA